MTPRAKFLAIVAVFALPVIAATFAYFGWRPTSHGNYGTLIPPAPLAHTRGATVDGEPYDLAALKGNWVMVHVGPATCDADCARLLWLMRQTRIAQGKDQTRIARLWVVEGGGAPSAPSLAGQDGLVVWRPAEQSFVDQFPASAARARHLYLVDPLGNLMLRFPADPDPKRLMKDLRLLLKASQIG